jgi:DNA-binding NtrC family response regulator
VNNRLKKGVENELEQNMLSILLVGKNPEVLANFADQLSRREGIAVSRAGSGKAGWDILEKSKVDVVVTDEKLADGDSLSFVKELTKQQPLINCAMVSSLSPEDFHEATEGLGVFMQLPVDPGAEEAVKMMELLESISALLAAKGS